MRIKLTILQESPDEADQPSEVVDSTPVSEGDDIQFMPEIVNLQEFGLRRSSSIAKQKSQSSIRRSVLTTLFLFWGNTHEPC